MMHSILHSNVCGQCCSQHLAGLDSMKFSSLGGSVESFNGLLALGHPCQGLLHAAYCLLLLLLQYQTKPTRLQPSRPPNGCTGSCCCQTAAIKSQFEVLCPSTPAVLPVVLALFHRLQEPCRARANQKDVRVVVDHQLVSKPLKILSCLYRSVKGR